jgi:methenyltetrahydromethanopterin cyclohydrolase
VESLNARAWSLCDQLASEADRLRVRVHAPSGQMRVLDCGVQAEGGLEAGLKLAEICLAGHGHVQLTAASDEMPWPRVLVHTDQPVLACMASQYAGWQLTADGFFAMGSGPMRAAANCEELIKELGYSERPGRVVGVLETAKWPPAAIAEKIAAACGVSPSDITLAVARTASLAGTLQVVARSVETALHKLHALGYDLARVISGLGTAPLPPVAADDLTALGRTNDAILYGADVTLWVRDTDETLQNLGPQLPSAASSAFGQPFLQVFEQAGRDFYRIDPHLFSPARVTLINLRTGRLCRYGTLRPDILRQSFEAE